MQHGMKFFHALVSRFTGGECSLFILRPRSWWLTTPSSEIYPMPQDKTQMTTTNSHRHHVSARAPRSFRRIGGCAALFAAVTAIAAESSADQSSSFALFETGQVRPLAISPNGQKLYAVNTPDNRLEIFYITNSGLLHVGSISVGLEPVAVAARNDNEVWVVNHLSDSVSVVDTTYATAPRVLRTLLVADEPRDIVFAGPGKNRAFITTAHRGQNAPYDPQLTTPGIGRADVWVFDANNLGSSSLGGTPLTIVSLFSDTPRALAVTPDGSRVYAAGFHSGNRSTSIHRNIVQAELGYPAPITDHTGEEQPPTAKIVQHNGQHWVDSDGYVWDHGVNFNLPDKDVFVINANSNPPAQLAGNQGFYTGVGTILFNMAVNPVSGKVYVTNTEANNLNRFSGPGTFAGTTVQGHLHESRITVLSPNGTVTPRHLNKHINYNQRPAPAGVKEKSLSTPTEMAITSNGSTLYVAALGSSKIGVFNTAALENNSFVPSAANHIVLDDDGDSVGPSGLVLDEARNRLYVLTRFDNSVVVVDTVSKSVTSRKRLYNPEPESAVEGRRFLYDARATSSNGEASCASCHVFGDFDSLAWDLGNPDDATFSTPGPIASVFPVFLQQFNYFSANKGPMTTQSLRGMANHGPMHWRGDKTMGNQEESAQPNSGTFDEFGAFKQFNGAFRDLVGRTGPIDNNDMEDFADFALQIMYPPNPIRNLDNSLTAKQQAGRDRFFAPQVALEFSCNDCHRIDPDANAEYGEPIPGFFGSTGEYVFGEVPQPMKIPHLRNVYQKVGMFGMVAIPSIYPFNTDFKGDQVRGFGMTNDGSEDTVVRFLSSIGFDIASGLSPNGFDAGELGIQQREESDAYIMAFDSNLAPIVGQQVTMHHDNATVAHSRVTLMLQRADAGECDVVAKVRHNGDEVGFLYVGANQFESSSENIGTISRAALTLLAAQESSKPVTYTAVPPGSGERIGLDRDEDGHYDCDD